MSSASDKVANILPCYRSDCAARVRYDKRDKNDSHQDLSFLRYPAGELYFERAESPRAFRYNSPLPRSKIANRNLPHQGTPFASAVSRVILVLSPPGRKRSLNQGPGDKAPRQPAAETVRKSRGGKKATGASDPRNPKCDRQPASPAVNSGRFYLHAHARASQESRQTQPARTPLISRPSLASSSSSSFILRCLCRYLGLLSFTSSASMEDVAVDGARTETPGPRRSRLSGARRGSACHMGSWSPSCSAAE